MGTIAGNIIRGVGDGIQNAGEWVGDKIDDNSGAILGATGFILVAAATAAGGPLAGAAVGLAMKATLASAQGKPGAPEAEPIFTSFDQAIAYWDSKAKSYNFKVGRGGEANRAKWQSQVDAANQRKNEYVAAKAQAEAQAQAEVDRLNRLKAGAGAPNPTGATGSGRRVNFASLLNGQITIGSKRIEKKHAAIGVGSSVLLLILILLII